MIRLQMVPLGGGRINLYHKSEENIYSSLSKQDYSRNIPRNIADVDNFSQVQRVQLSLERSFNENNTGLRGWLNTEHVGEFNNKPFVYRNADVILPVVCVIALGLAIYFW